MCEQVPWVHSHCAWESDVRNLLTLPPTTLFTLQLHENMKAIEFVDKITDDIKKKVDDIIGPLAFEEQ